MPGIKLLRIEALPVLCLLAASLAAQTPAPQKPASVEGTVKDSVSGASIPRAGVRLGTYGTTASADGKFAISAIEPGRYPLVVERAGFVMAHGDGNAKTISLEPGEAKTDIEVTLTPTGTITGRVLDSDGNPVESAEVDVEPAGERPGMNSIGSPGTDENGAFRVGGLAPGRYRVKANHREYWGEKPEIRTDGTVDRHDASTWDPASLEAESAGTVVVQPGAETNGIEIRLVRVPIVRVSGKVIGVPRGAEDVNVTAYQGMSGVAIGTSADGHFELWRLDPGRYTLRAEWNAADGDQYQAAGTTIEVRDSNIDGIELRYVPPMTFTGRIEYEDDASRQIGQAGPQGPQVNLLATGAGGDGVIAQHAAADGSFRLEKVMPGKYRVRISDEKLFVKSMRLGPVAIEGEILDLSNGSGGADLSVILSASNGTITGTVQDDKGPSPGTVVALAPTEEDTDGSAFFTVRLTVAGPGGIYTFPHLAPGNFRIVATSDAEIGASTASGYESQMEDITVGPNETVTKDLKRRALE